MPRPLTDSDSGSGRGGGGGGGAGGGGGGSAGKATMPAPRWGDRDDDDDDDMLPSLQRLSSTGGAVSSVATAPAPTATAARTTTIARTAKAAPSGVAGGRGGAPVTQLEPTRRRGSRRATTPRERTLASWTLAGAISKPCGDISVAGMTELPPGTDHAALVASVMATVRGYTGYRGVPHAPAWRLIEQNNRTELCSVSAHQPRWPSWSRGPRGGHLSGRHAEGYRHLESGYRAPGSGRCAAHRPVAARAPRTMPGSTWGHGSNPPAAHRPRTHAAGRGRLGEPVHGNPADHARQATRLLSPNLSRMGSTDRRGRWGASPKREGSACAGSLRSYSTSIGRCLIMGCPMDSVAASA